MIYIYVYSHSPQPPSSLLLPSNCKDKKTFPTLKQNINKLYQMYFGDDIIKMMQIYYTIPARVAKESNARR